MSLRRIGEVPSIEGSVEAEAPEVVEVDPFEDDEPIVAACDLENPESCESCT